MHGKPLWACLTHAAHQSSIMQAHVLSAAACAASGMLHVALQFLAFGVVVSLLATASAMRWTVTAQLICNTPTMILEVGPPDFG